MPNCLHSHTCMSRILMMMMMHDTYCPWMMILSSILLTIHFATSSSSSLSSSSLSSQQQQPPSVYPVDEYVFYANIDHYSFRRTAVGTFPLRYYVNQQHWNNNNSSSNNNNNTTTTVVGPCLFYAGNEADIFQFINHTGFMFEAAEELGAMVVFAEHRYYGGSQIVIEDMSYLTVEQAMADFDTLNVHIRQTWNMPAQTAFIVLGGSYGGNLALWLRLKNPNLWAGAVASSATPLKHVLRETNAFALIETQVYGNVSSACPDLVRWGWKELRQKVTTCGGRRVAAQALGLCHSSFLSLSDDDDDDDDDANTRRSDFLFANIHGWVSNALETMVQYGYPYPTSFYNPVPAYPFRVACHGMLSNGTGLGALRAAVDVYYNYTGQAGSCYDFDAEVSIQAERYWKRKGDHGRLRMTEYFVESRPQRSRSVMQSSLSIDTEDAWDYQTCTEVYQPMPTDGVTDFEVPYTPNQQQYYDRCLKKWGVQPRPNWEETMFMGNHIQAGSNIFLTSGQLDPWRAAGIQEKPKGAPDSILVRTIEHGAHHLDLRASHPADPPSVVAVRNEEKAAMRQWIAEWEELYS